VRPPTKFARTPATLRLPAPLLGQHTDEVLREAGYDDAQIAALKARRVVFSAPPPVHDTPIREETPR
jgi:crotonobetainyl-CoA:carnitine CoA-transferase CaiB-like acyl-CoA transferase